jgi:hypothetical protein
VWLGLVSVVPLENTRKGSERSNYMGDLSAGTDLSEVIDRKSFIVGMIAAFAECLAYECKKAAFSPPFLAEDYERVHDEAVKIAREQGIYLCYEENADIPAEKRVNWFVMYKYPEVLDEYKRLRNRGYNPAWDLEKFYGFLSYGIVWGKDAEKVIPEIREKKAQGDTVSRILFSSGGWPITKS